jgi:aminoglycoside phosphotransferase (APT) family kinase protein
MDLKTLEDYVNKIGLLKNATVKQIGFGESNINYLATSGDTKIVIRTARNDVPNEPRFEDEHHFMKFIEFVNITFAPRSLHYDPRLNIHIVSYVEGDDASAADLNSKQIKLLITELKELESIKYRDYLNWCESTNESVHPAKSLQLRTKLYFIDRIMIFRAKH